MLRFIGESTGKRYISHNYLSRRKLQRMIHFAYKAVWSRIDHTVNLTAQFAAFVIAARLFFVFIQNEWKQRRLILTIHIFLLEAFCHPVFSLFFGLDWVTSWTNNPLYWKGFCIIPYTLFYVTTMFSLERKNFH